MVQCTEVDQREHDSNEVVQRHMKSLKVHWSTVNGEDWSWLLRGSICVRSLSGTSSPRMSWINGCKTSVGNLVSRSRVCFTFTTLCKFYVQLQYIQNKYITFKCYYW